MVFYCTQRSGIEAVGERYSVAYGYLLLNKVTKVDDIFYRPAELGRAGNNAEIFDAVEERYSSAPIAASVLAADFTTRLSKY